MSAPDHGTSPRADQRHVLSFRVDTQLFEAIARDATRLAPQMRPPEAFDPHHRANVS
jgi:hypothetical protein